MRDHIRTLTENQKVCLRLVARGMTSKEIAAETGLTPQTVDTYLKAAMAKLGASSRREAARMLSSVEASQRLGSPPAALAAAALAADDGDAARGRGLATWLAPPPVGGRDNDLGPAQKTYAVLRVAGIGSATVIALALAIAGLLQTFS